MNENTNEIKNTVEAGQLERRVMRLPRYGIKWNGVARCACGRALTGGADEAGKYRYDAAQRPAKQARLKAPGILTTPNALCLSALLCTNRRI